MTFAFQNETTAVHYRRCRPVALSQSRCAAIRQMVSHVWSHFYPNSAPDLLETSPRPVTAPSPQSGLVSRSRVVRVTTPTSPTSKFELEQNAFEQWLVNKLKADQEQRRVEAENDMQKTKEKNEKGTLKVNWPIEHVLFQPRKPNGLMLSGCSKKRRETRKRLKKSANAKK